MSLTLGAALVGDLSVRIGVAPHGYAVMTHRSSGTHETSLSCYSEKEKANALEEFKRLFNKEIDALIAKEKENAP